VHLLPGFLGVGLRGVLDVELPRVCVERIVRHRLNLDLAAAVGIDACRVQRIDRAVALGFTHASHLGKFPR
jgi:hypothetical protein